MRKAIMQLARDPSLVPHVYDYCDQWCRYCRITDQCLVYRVERMRESQSTGVDGQIRIDSDDTALGFARAVASATRTPVARLDLLLTDPEKAPRKGAIGDPLELLGRRYAMQANAYLQSAGFDYWELPRAPEATPLTVLGWFHLIIASKIYRALVSLRRAKNDPTLLDDANGSAKLVLVGIERSRQALEEIRKQDPDARTDALHEYLGLLAAQVEARFPAARTFVRAGLDAEAIALDDRAT